MKWFKKLQEITARTQTILIRWITCSGVANVGSNPSVPTMKNMLYKTARRSLSKKTNRHLRQTTFLYEMCGNDFQKLLKVEERLKNYFLFYCPGDPEEVEKVLALPEKFLLNDKKWQDGSKYFCLEEFYDGM